MARLTQAIMTALLIVTVAGTGAFAAGQQEGTDKTAVKAQDTRKAPPPRPDRQAREDTRRERDRIIREFQQSLRAAEQKFKKDQKAASGLRGAERKAAMQKASTEMKTTINAAKKKRDADMEQFVGHKKRPPKKKHRPEKRKKGPEMNSGESTSAQAAQPAAQQIQQ